MKNFLKGARAAVRAVGQQRSIQTSSVRNHDIAQKWVMAKAFDGMPQKGDLKLCTERLPCLNDGDILVKTTSISIDPYQRAVARWLKCGDVMPGTSIGKVIETRNDDYPCGATVLASVGWRDKSLLSPIFDKHEPDSVGLFNKMEELPDLACLDTSYGLGVLGMHGIVAYYGMTDVLHARPGETVLINSAAGGVGHLAGQIARIMGCKVIGLVSSDEKVKWCQDLGFHAAINYKCGDIDCGLRNAAPGGIDCFFDNVGGPKTAKIMTDHMRYNGRIYSCGAIEAYFNGDSSGQYPFSSFLTSQLRQEGASLIKWRTEWPKAYNILGDWVRKDKIQYKEYCTKGFECCPDAFIAMLSGQNIGKTVVKCDAI